MREFGYQRAHDITGAVSSSPPTRTRATSAAAPTSST